MIAFIFLALMAAIVGLALAIELRGSNKVTHPSSTSEEALSASQRNDLGGYSPTAFKPFR